MSDIFELIAQQRTRVVDCLEGLDESDWELDSLCRGWTVRNVVAHLTMAFSVSVPTLIFRLAKAGGNFNRISNEFARSQSTKSNDELIGILRAHVASRFTPPGLGPEAPLSDTVIHGFDIAVPTKREIEVDDESFTRVLNFLVSKKASRGFVRPRTTNELEFSCPEIGWRWGSGPIVEGSAKNMVLALTGRRESLGALRGDGVAILSRRATY